MKKIFAFLVVAGLVIGGSGIASAVTLFDRGLPDINLNNAAGSSRSNVSWSYGSAYPDWFMGDDFTIGTTGQSYVINSLTVWGVQHDPLSTDINNVSLYLGQSGGTLGLLSSGSVTGSNPNISFAFVNYPSTATNYQGSSGSYIPIVETTFSGLNIVVQGGVTYNFGVLSDTGGWFNHASNAALSGTPQQGADGLMLAWNTSDLSTADVWDSNGSGWDKSSDINVRITGAPVPIPGALVLFGSGLLGLVGIGRKRLRK